MNPVQHLDKGIDNVSMSMLLIGITTHKCLFFNFLCFYKRVKEQFNPILHESCIPKKKTITLYTGDRFNDLNFFQLQLHNMLFMPTYKYIFYVDMVVNECSSQ
jgi:hypothetical protein